MFCFLLLLFYFILTFSIFDAINILIFSSNFTLFYVAKFREFFVSGGGMKG